MKLRRFFEDKHGKVVIFQIPNAPLLLWIVCTIVGKFAHGSVHTAISTLGTLSLLVWALLEVFKGDSYFRRTLGTVVLFFTVYSFFQ